MAAVTPFTSINLTPTIKVLNNSPENSKIALFKGNKIRKTLHRNEWWFVVIDIVEALTDSADPKQYINRMRQRDVVNLGTVY